MESIDSKPPKDVTPKIVVDLADMKKLKLLQDGDKRLRLDTLKFITEDSQPNNLCVKDIIEWIQRIKKSSWFSYHSCSDIDVV